ncbi:MAG: CPBP family intramembrane glutamic endopeptidase [Liquorilactobacillus satsumensis]
MGRSRINKGFKQLFVAFLSFSIFWISAALRAGNVMLTIQLAIIHCVMVIIFLVMYYLIFKTTKLKIRQKIELRWAVTLSALLILFIFVAFNGIYTHIYIVIKSANFLVILLIAVSSALLEEFLFRGMFFQAILNILSKSNLPLTYSGIISSLLFGFWHLSNFFWGGRPLESTLQQVIFAIAMGLILVAVRIISKDIWLSVLIHSWIDLVPSGPYMSKVAPWGSALLIYGIIITFLIFIIFIYEQGLFFKKKLLVSNKGSMEHPNEK